mgnify:CR=1 FL=1
MPWGGASGPYYPAAQLARSAGGSRGTATSRDELMNAGGHPAGERALATEDTPK